MTMSESKIFLGYEPNELSYWAGFFDGEGCISIYKYQNKDQWHKSLTYSAMIQLAICDKEILDQLDILFKGTRAVRKHSRPNSRPQYYWQRRGNKAVEIIKQLLPFLRLKKPQGELALEFHKQKGRNPSRLLSPSELRLRDEYYWRMRKLNVRGKDKK